MESDHANSRIRRVPSTNWLAEQAPGMAATGTLPGLCARLTTAMVQKERVELSRPCGHCLLRAARLPIPPLLHLGADGRTRTSNILCVGQALYPIELRRQRWMHVDSNHDLLGYGQACALTPYIHEAETVRVARTTPCRATAFEAASHATVSVSVGAEHEARTRETILAR